MGSLQRKLYLNSKDPEGVQMLISIETHITCDFTGGGGSPDPPIPPLDCIVSLSKTHLSCLDLSGHN